MKTTKTRRQLSETVRHWLKGTRAGLPELLPRQVKPVSRYWGYDRGQPIDRYYIEKFLAANAEHIRGRVLEIGDKSYTRQYGGEHVTVSDVLHVIEGNPAATIVGDLAKGTTSLRTPLTASS